MLENEITFRKKNQLFQGLNIWVLLLTFNSLKSGDALTVRQFTATHKSSLWNLPVSEFQMSYSDSIMMKGYRDRNSSNGHHSVMHSWWRHQMEKFSALLAICAGNSPVTGEFPAQRPVTQSFDVFFDLRLHKQLINNCEAGDLRYYCAHYGVIVM